MHLSNLKAKLRPSLKYDLGLYQLISFLKYKLQEQYFVPVSSMFQYYKYIYQGMFYLYQFYKDTGLITSVECN